MVHKESTWNVGSGREVGGIDEGLFIQASQPWILSPAIRPTLGESPSPPPLAVL